MDTPHPAYETGGRGYPARGPRVDSIHAHPQKSRARTILPILILAVLAVAIIGWFLSRRHAHQATTTPTTTIQQTTTPTTETTTPTTQTTTPAAVPVQTDAGVQTGP